MYHYHVPLPCTTTITTKQEGMGSTVPLLATPFTANYEAKIHQFTFWQIPKSKDILESISSSIILSGTAWLFYI